MQLNRTIITNDLIICDYKSQEKLNCFNLWTDAECGKYLGDPCLDAVNEKYLKCLDEMEDNQYGYYLVVYLKDSKEFAGTFSMFPDENKNYDIGYALKKQYWKKGYGSQILEAMLDGIKKMGGLSVSADVVQDNAASCALLKKFGFKITGTKTLKKWNMDVVYPEHIFSLEL